MQKAEGFSVIQKHPSTSHGRSRSPGYFFSRVSLFSPQRLTNTTLVTSGKKKNKAEGKKKGKQRQTDSLRKVVLSLTPGLCALFYFRSLCACLAPPSARQREDECVLVFCDSSSSSWDKEMMYNCVLHPNSEGIEMWQRAYLHVFCCSAPTRIVSPSKLGSPECFHIVSCQVEPAAGAIRISRSC